MYELRFEMQADDIAVIDAYCSATGRCRSDVVREILALWAKEKLHEATLILRVAGHTPVRSESHSGSAGK